MLRSKSERVDRPPLRPMKPRSMSHRYNTRSEKQGDDSIISLEDQDRLWLMRGSQKSHEPSRNDDHGDVSENWWWKRWSNSVKRGIDQWSTTEDNFKEDAAGAGSPGLKLRWGWIAKWFTREHGIISSILYPRKTVCCQYDEHSYAQNFDEGISEEEDVYLYRSFSARFAAPVIPVIPLSG